MLGTEKHNPNWIGRLPGADLSVAYALLRITLGINIALHGISRILAGPAIFVATLTNQFAATPLPHVAVQVFGYALPWFEASLGLLILFGALTRIALIGGALLIIVLTFGSSLHQDWDIAGLQLIYAAVYFGLLALHRYNWFAVDGLFSKES
jgi:thiosulfate dehydrogenase (quinone) large subunit